MDGACSQNERSRESFKVLTGKPTGRKQTPKHDGRTTLLSTHDMISCLVVAVMQWPGSLITSCCSSGLTQL